MSAHDFQAKFASVMESILRSAIAETTKLFEAMVEDLKADMSRIKKDNDDLKAKCSQFEFAQKDGNAGNNPSKKRHSAVQCDIISFCNKVAEQSHQSVPTQCSHQDMFYLLQEHDYDGDGLGVDRHEVVSRQELNSAYCSGNSLYAEAGETGSEEASPKTKKLPQELTDLRMYNDLQRGQNQKDRPQTPLGCHETPPNSALIVNTSQAPTLEPRQVDTSVTLQDARLLVEAMSSLVERRVFSSQQGMTFKPRCVPSVDAQQTADGALEALQIRPHSSTSPKAVQSLIIKEVSAVESSQESVNVVEHSEAESQIGASSAATAAAVLPHSSSSLKTSAPGKEVKKVPPKIIFLPSSVSLQNCDRAKRHPTLVSAAAMKVDTAKNSGPVQTSTTPVLIPGALATFCGPPLNSSSTSLPVTETTIFRELPQGTQRHPKIKIVIPVQKIVEREPESDNSNESADHFPPQEEELPLESPTPSGMVSIVPQAEQEYSESSLSLNSLAGSKGTAALQIKPFAVVKLTRLPFPMSMDKSVLISRLPLGSLEIARRDSHLVSNEDTGSSRPSSKSTSAITDKNIAALSPTGSPSANLPQDEVTWETGQPLEQKTSSEDQEKDSTSLEVGNATYQHAETQTVSYKKLQKDQKDSKDKLDLAEIAEAVSSSRTNSDFTLQTRKSGLSVDVPEPPASKDKDPNDDISSPEEGTTPQATTVYTRGSSPVRKATLRNTKPGRGHSDADVSPRSLRRTSPDTGKPENDSLVISSEHKTRAAESALVVHETRSFVQLGSSVKDRKIRSNSSGRRKNDESDTNFKSAVVKKSRVLQAQRTSQTSLKAVNAKKLAKKAKAKLVKKKASRRLLRKHAKAAWLEANQPSNVAVKKIRSSGVWIPPVGDARQNEPEHVSLKTETTVLKSPDGVAVDPPGVSVSPVAVRAAPVVSPLQPLSLIGTRLLKNQCGVCGQVLGSSSALESHVGLHSRRPFSCRLCGKIFADTKALKRHDRVHRNGKIHVCQKCGKAFVYKFSLTKHLEMVHRRIKPFVCQICGKSFFTKLHVESHIRVHTGEKPFHCNLCDRKFIRRVDLNVHLRWHNGEKRHWCPYCKKGFLDFNNLKRHKYIHTGEKPHPCTHCPKQFTQSAHLKKHIKNVHKIAEGS